MGLASSLQKVAGKAIGRLGGDVTIRFLTQHPDLAEGAYNTTTGEICPTTSDVKVKGVVENVSQREANELIRADDKKLTIAANSLKTAPESSDQVVINDVVHQIVERRTIEQDNTAITYELFLRA